MCFYPRSWSSLSDPKEEDPAAAIGLAIATAEAHISDIRDAIERARVEYVLFVRLQSSTSDSSSREVYCSSASRCRKRIVACLVRRRAYIRALDALNEVYTAVEGAKTAADIARIISDSNAALREQMRNVSVDKIDDVMDEMSELIGEAGLAAGAFERAAGEIQGMGAPPVTDEDMANLQRQVDMEAESVISFFPAAAPVAPRSTGSSTGAEVGGDQGAPQARPTEGGRTDSHREWVSLPI